MNVTPPRSRVRRRSLLATIVAGLAALAMRPLHAKSTLAITEADHLSLQVIVDSGTFGAFLPDLDLPGLKVQRAGNGGPAQMPRMLPHALFGEFGLSILGAHRRCQASTRCTPADRLRAPRCLRDRTPVPAASSTSGLYFADDPA